MSQTKKKNYYRVCCTRAWNRTNPNLFKKGIKIKKLNVVRKKT